MHTEDLLSLNIAIFDLGPHTIGLTKRALDKTGFKNIHLFQDAEKLIQFCRDATLDLLIIDDTHETEEALGVIRRLRDPSEGLSQNCRIVALLAERSEKSLGKAISAGVDNVLVKPLVTDKVRANLLQVMRDESPYLEFENYSGPDRRRRPSQVSFSGEDRRTD